MAVNFSDDELNERIIRAAADATVKLTLLSAEMISAAERCANAMCELGESMEHGLDEAVAGLTAEQRFIYNALVATGTQPLDAACEAEELA